MYLVKPKEWTTSIYNNDTIKCSEMCYNANKDI